MFPHRVHETIQVMSYSLLKAVLSSIVCVYQVRWGFCYHCVGQLVVRPYELMIDFCSDPNHTSCRERNKQKERMACRCPRPFPGVLCSCFCLREDTYVRARISSIFVLRVSSASRSVGLGVAVPISFSKRCKLASVEMTLCSLLAYSSDTGSSV